MKIITHRIGTDFNGEYCKTHARGAVLPSGKILITTQPLLLSGVDVFFGIEKLTVDRETFAASAITPCHHLTRQNIGGNLSMVMCDSTPLYHKATGKALLLGTSEVYDDRNDKPATGKPHYTLYAVYDDAAQDFGSFAALDMGDERYLYTGNGCGQSYEEENGDLLIPVSVQDPEAAKRGIIHASAAVMRCAFDGKTLTLKEIGTALSSDVPRGFYEPSVIKYRDHYYMCIRNDVTGYLAKSRDGLHFDAPVPLFFDNGALVGNYDTQQHFLTGGGKLFLVYTRKAENNGHIYNHRAPLFIAEVDTERMCLIKETEQIAVPERGARLGNFGCCSYSESLGYVFASEWMQHDGCRPGAWKDCMKYGSDNSIFISEIRFF